MEGWKGARQRTADDLLIDRMSEKCKKRKEERPEESAMRRSARSCLLIKNAKDQRTFIKPSLLSITPDIYLFTYFLLCSLIHLFISVFIHSFVYLFIYFTCLFIPICMYLFIYLCFGLLAYVYIHSFLYLFIHSFICFCFRFIYLITYSLIYLFI